MTKGNVLPKNMSENSVHHKSAFRNDLEVGENLIYPCKAKVEQILHCCEDVAEQLDLLQSNLKARRNQEETEVPVEFERAKIENLILHDELCKSKIRIEELEVTETKLRKKIMEMEEKVQTLSAQLIVYKEDFDLERRDRERAQGRILELEQKMLAYQRPRESQSQLYPAVRQIRNYSFGDLTERGYDVCDGISKEEVMRCQEDGLRNEVQPWLSKSGHLSSVEFQAQSFDIRDFFPTPSASSDISVYKHDHGEVNCDQSVQADKKVMSIFCSTEIQPNHQPSLTHQPSWNHQPSWSEAVSSNKMNTRFYEQPNAFKPSGNDDTVLPPSKLITAGIAVKSRQPVDRPGFHRTAQAAPLHDKNQEDNSVLRCPKCNKCFTLLDHLLLLEHLEDC